MKKKFFAMFAIAALLLGTISCANEDNPSNTTPVDVSALEDSLIGLWWDEFEYSDVTEAGDPFNKVMLVVSIEEDYTGCIYLAVFDDESEDPLAVYGGIDESDFTWKVLEDGNILLGDPETGETYSLARTRGDGGNYGNNMTDPSKTSMNYGNNKLNVSNGSYSGALTRADANQSVNIQTKINPGNVLSNVALKSGGKTPEGFESDDIR